MIRELLSAGGSDVRYVWRHLPLNDVHPNAQLAAEASEAAAAQGHFWEMYDLLLAHQGKLRLDDLEELREGARPRCRSVHGRDAPPRRTWTGSARTSRAPMRAACPGTPTFFINGRRHYGVYDIDTLTNEVRAAKRRAQLLARVAA